MKLSIKFHWILRSSPDIDGQSGEEIFSESIKRSVNFAGISFKLSNNTGYLHRLFSYFQPWSLAFAFNPFPHIDVFWRLCRRWLFKNMATKEEIAPNNVFKQCFQIYSIIVHSFDVSFQFFCGSVFKVVCCRFVVCGKGFIKRLNQLFKLSNNT